MANKIHPTSIVHPKAEIGANNYIGPFCNVGPNVILGNHNRLEGYVSIGTPAEHRDYFSQEPGHVEIGNNCIFREFITVNASTAGTTRIGSDVVMLRGSHVGHDAIIEDFANLSCNVLIGGHTKIGRGANIGLSAVIHQFRVIGAYAMIGMNATVTRNTPPFVIAFGSPCEPQRVNRIGLQRSGVSEKDLQIFEDWFQEIQGVFDRLPDLSHEYGQYVRSYLKNIDELNI